MLLITGNRSMAAFSFEISIGVRGVRHQYGVNGLQAVIQTLQPSGDSFVELSKTETLFGLSDLVFANKCPLSLQFEKLQRIRIVLHSYLENGDLCGIYGECQLDLSIIFASGGNVTIPIHGTTSVVDVTAIVPEFYSQHLRMAFSGSHLHSPENLPLALYFVVSLPTETRTIHLYKSEVIKNEKNPTWNSMSVPLYMFHFYNDSTMQLHVYNQNVNHADSLVGYCTTTLTQLQRGVGAFNSYMLVHSNGRRIGEKTCVELQKLELESGPDFFQLIKSTQLQVMEAVDFTASNESVVKESSLHYIHPHRPSMYLKSILDATPPLLAYMANPANPKIGALGFGAQVPSGGQPKLSNCFFLSGSATDPLVLGLDGLLDAYRNARMTAKLFGPTEFSEVIYFVSKFAKAESRKHVGLYFVLLIFSDGGPANLRRTIDALVDVSTHPMSVVAIGVGENRDFSPMKALESPVLKHSDNRPLARQNYIFVEAKDLQTSDALSLLPMQMVQWKRQFDSV